MYQNLLNLWLKIAASKLRKNNILFQSLFRLFQKIYLTLIFKKNRTLNIY